MPKKILVVDDEKHIVELIERTLQQAGYETVGTTDGAQGLQLLKDEEFDMVILNDSMPKPDGQEILRRMKANPALQEIPVIMIIDSIKDESPFRFWQLGMDCIVCKPIDRTELLFWVKRVLSSIEDSLEDDH